MPGHVIIKESEMQPFKTKLDLLIKETGLERKHILKAGVNVLFNKIFEKKMWSGLGLKQIIEIINKEGEL